MNATLPYRSDPDDIRRFLVALAHGGGESRISTLGLSRKNHEGVVAAVVALGLAAGREGPLTDKGRRVAVTASAADSADAWLGVMQEYSPYAAIVSAVESGRAPLPLTLEWIETYWAANGMGSSESNRAEGAATFARIAEAAGCGRFRQGRRGHLSRVEWNGRSADATTTPPRPEPDRRASAEAGGEGRRRTPASPPTAEVAHAAHEASSGARARGPGSVRSTPPEPVGGAPDAQPSNRIEWELSPGRMLRVSVPSRLTPEEAVRINDLLRLLIPE